MASAEISTVDHASLDAFRSELIQAGFEPQGGDRRRWAGPIAEPLKALTDATSMRVVIEDGWPYQPPKLFVCGIDSDHAVYGGELCLYQAGDDSMGWITFSGYLERIASWVREHAEGFRPEDELLDAHLFFRPVLPGELVTLEISSLELERGGELTGHLYATLGIGEQSLALSASRPAGQHLSGRWYLLPQPPPVPPRNLSVLEAALSSGQLNNFKRRLDNLRGGERLVFAFFWETRHSGHNGLVLLGDRDEGGDPRLQSAELAPTDADFRLMRGGPDVALLDAKSVVIFGVGAIGSNLACRLAESGLGAITLVDGQRLRPSNFIRHAGVPVPGMPKVDATKTVIGMRAPWTEVSVKHGSPWSMEQILLLLEGSDLVIEATGSAAFAELLARIAAPVGTPLLSAALYRGGDVARIRRQAAADDVPLAERLDPERFPLIPVGEKVPPRREPGCAAAINNASPISVAAIAASAAEVAIDALSERFAYGGEVIDVYRPLEEAPFDAIGRLRG